jgi:hypothetical protein
LPIFKVSARFTSEEVSFSPTVAEVKMMLSQRLSDGIKMIYSRPLLSDDKDFKEYMSALDENDEKEEGRMNPLKSVEESEELVQRKEDIEGVLNGAFAQLEEYKKELQPFIKIYKDHCARDFTELEGKQDQEYRMWVDEFDLHGRTVKETLEDVKVLGIVSVETAELKNAILAKPRESREKMAQIIPQHCGLIVERLTQKMKEIDAGITTTTTWTIDEYVAYKRFLEEHRRNSDDYEEQLRKAKSLHEIMSTSGMHIGKQKKELESLENRWKNVKERLKQSNDKCEAAESGQKANLVKSVPDMAKYLEDLWVMLDAEKFYKKTEAPATVVEDLQAIENKIKEAEARCQKINEHQSYLQIPKDEIGDIARLKEKHLHLLKFWKDQLHWSEKKADWFQKQIKQLDIEVMSATIHDMKETAKNAETTLHSFEIAFDIAKVFSFTHPLSGVPREGAGPDADNDIGDKARAGGHGGGATLEGNSEEDRMHDDA